MKPTCGGLSSATLCVWLAGLMLSFLPVSSAASAGEEAPAKALTRIYQFGELLTRAETIAICEVRTAQAGNARLRVVEWLKGPPDEVRNRMDEIRAAARLTQEAAAKDNKNGGAATPELELDIGIEVLAPFEPPATGTLNLYVLWDRLEATKDLPLRYRVGHPQCVYESTYAAEVKSELSRTRTAPRRAYLRAWDARMAARLQLQKQEAELLRMKPGHTEKGLRLTFRFAKVSQLSPNSFDVSFNIENLLDAEQAIYDGPLPAFGVRVREKDAPDGKPLMLFAGDDGDSRAAADAEVLSLIDVNDFIGVPKKDRLIKTLHFSAKEHAALAKLKGEFSVCAFYSSTQDGKGLENLPGVPWVGTLVSDEGSLTFDAAGKP